MNRFKIEVKHQGQRLVKGVLNLEEAGIHLLKGPVGCGKTSVLRQLYRRSPRHVLFGKLSFFSYATLDYPFADEETGTEIIERVMELTALNRESLVERLKRLQIFHLLSQKVGLLSAGERLRFSLALALAVERPALLVDEPFSLVDSRTADLIRRELLDVAEKRPVLVVTHDERLDEDAVAIYVIEDQRLILKKDGSILAAHIGADATKKRKHLPLDHRDRWSRISLAVSTFTSLFLCASLLPLSECLRPTSKNYQLLSAQADQRDHQRPLGYQLDFGEKITDEVSMFPDRLTYELYGKSFALRAAEVHPILDFLLVVNNDDDHFHLSSDLHAFFQRRHGEFPLEQLAIGGVSASPEVEKESGYYLTYPRRYRCNLNTASSFRTVTAEDRILNEDLEPITLKAGQAALSYQEYRARQGAMITECGLYLEPAGFVLKPTSKILVSEQTDLTYVNILHGAEDLAPTGDNAKWIDQSTIFSSVQHGQSNIGAHLKNSYLDWSKKTYLMPSLIATASLVVFSLFASLALFLFTTKERQAEFKLKAFYWSAPALVGRWAFRLDGPILVLIFGLLPHLLQPLLFVHFVTLTTGCYAILSGSFIILFLFLQLLSSALYFGYRRHSIK